MICFFLFFFFVLTATVKVNCAAAAFLERIHTSGLQGVQWFSDFFHFLFWKIGLHYVCFFLKNVSNVFEVKNMENSIIFHTNPKVDSKCFGSELESEKKTFSLLLRKSKASIFEPLFCVNM